MVRRANVQLFQARDRSASTSLGMSSNDEQQEVDFGTANQSYQFGVICTVGTVVQTGR